MRQRVLRSLAVMVAASAMWWSSGVAWAGLEWCCDASIGVYGAGSAETGDPVFGLLPPVVAGVEWADLPVVTALGETLGAITSVPRTVLFDLYSWSWDGGTGSSDR